MPPRRPSLHAAATASDPIVLAGPDAGLIAIDFSFATPALSITGGVALTGTITADRVSIAGTLALTGAASLLADNIDVLSGTVLAQGGGATLRASGTLTLAGGAAALGGGSILAGTLVLASATLDLDAASAIGVGGAADAGTIVVAPGALLQGYGRLDGPLGNDGTVLAQGGALSVFGDANGGGTLAIGADGTLYVAGTVSPSLTLEFTGPRATLDLLTLGQHFAAPVGGFADGDAIAVAEASLTGAVWQDGTLALTAADGTALALPLQGDFAGARFVPIPDGAGGSLVKLTSASISGLIGTDLTLGDGGDLLDLAGTLTSVSLTIDNQVALTGTAGLGTLVLAGTLVELAGAGLTADDISGFGVLAAEGAPVTVRHATALAATIDVLGGAVCVLQSATLAGGALLVDADSALVVGTAAGQAGHVRVASGATLSGFGRLAAPSDIAGVLQAQGGAMVIAAPASGSGVATIGQGATLAVFAPLALPVQFAPGATLALEGATVTGPLEGFGAGDIIALPGQSIDAVQWSPGTLALLSGGVATATLAVAGDYTALDWQAESDGAGGTRVGLTGGSAPPLDVGGAFTIAGSFAAASASVEPGGVLTLAGGTLSSPGLAIADGGMLTGLGALTGTLDLAGTLAVTSGLFSVAGHIAGSGTVLIGAGATLYAPQGLGEGVSVAFTGDNATLELFGPALQTGASIAGLPASPGNPSGNAIDLAAVRITQADYRGLGGGAGAIDLSGPDGALGSLALTGLDAPPSILLRPDGAGGTLLQLVPCFVAGTRIATPDGEVPVEQLRPGDAVLTPTGPRRLCWTAARRTDSRGAPERRPVCIPPGALGGGLPWRGLMLSPRHAVRVGRVLVPAAALACGNFIARAASGPVAYFHLGLEPHGMVWAEGALVETYRPDGAPSDGSPEFDIEHGERPRAGPPCLPLCEQGPALESLRHRLFGPPPPATAPGPLRGHVEQLWQQNGRTLLEGWACDDASPNRPVALHLLCCGKPAGRILANLWRPDLDRAGLRGGACGFRYETGLAIPPLQLRRPSDGALLPGPVTIR